MDKNAGLRVVKCRWEAKVEKFRQSMKFHKDVSVVERIFSLILGSCCKDVKKHFQNDVAGAERIKSIIEIYVQKNVPIPVTITFALYMRAKNSFKFSESHKNFPHLGWADFLCRLKYLNEKVKTFYQPGIRIFIFEEASLFYPVLNWRREDVDAFEVVVKNIIISIDMTDMLEIIPMGDMNFPTWDDWRQGITFEYASEHAINDSVVFAMMTSCEEFTDRCLMDCLYSQNVCDYEMIKSLYQSLWQIAYLKASYVRHVMDMRKSQNLWGKYVKEYYHAMGIDVNEHDFLDGVITHKPGRLSLDMGMVLPNHGMMILDGKGHRIEPEYRLQDTKALPVKASSSGKEFIFFYQT